MIVEILSIKPDPVPNGKHDVTINYRAKTAYPGTGKLKITLAGTAGIRTVGPNPLQTSENYNTTWTNYSKTVSVVVTSNDGPHLASFQVECTDAKGYSNSDQKSFTHD